MIFFVPRWDTVDGSEIPKPTTWHVPKTLVNNGDFNHQPQVIFTSDFRTINPSKIGGTPISRPKSCSFLVGFNPWLLGKPCWFPVGYQQARDSNRASICRPGFWVGFHFTDIWSRVSVHTGVGVGVAFGKRERNFFLKCHLGLGFEEEFFLKNVCKTWKWSLFGKYQVGQLPCIYSPPLKGSGDRHLSLRCIHGVK